MSTQNRKNSQTTTTATFASCPTVTVYTVKIGVRGKFTTEKVTVDAIGTAMAQFDNSRADVSMNQDGTFTLKGYKGGSQKIYLCDSLMAWGEKTVFNQSSVKARADYCAAALQTEHSEHGVRCGGYPEIADMLSNGAQIEIAPSGQTYTLQVSHAVMLAMGTPKFDEQ